MIHVKNIISRTCKKCVGATCQNLPDLSSFSERHHQTIAQLRSDLHCTKIKIWQVIPFLTSIFSFVIRLIEQPNIITASFIHYHKVALLSFDFDTSN